MRVLVIGSGGREHALVWKLSQSPLVKKIYAMPGNPGMQELAELVDIATNNLEQMAEFAIKEKIDLTVVGPEIVLAAGINDVFATKGLKLFGPTKKAAQIESSKAFAKDLMEKYNIPTAYYKVCNDIESAKAYINEKGAPIVVKADGLAAGKGVIVAMTLAEALDAVEQIMAGDEFGTSGSRVVIEEYLEGEEASVLAFTDGKTIVPMVAAQDHKRALDGDKGSNTGGMGTYAPAPIMTDVLYKECLEKVLKPTIKALEQEGCFYQGCLYAGLMVTKDGIKVIEFNARFGDPETQVVLPLLESDLAQIMLDCVEGKLKDVTIDWRNQAAVCVVMASGGYPAEYAKGKVIEGLEQANNLSDVTVFHAGTKKESDNIVTAGGRVLGVTAIAKNIAEAQKKAYMAVEKIHFADAHFRKDIAWRAIK